MEIEEDSRSCSPEICSNINDSTKKRKLQSEQFDLPCSKHKCVDQEGFTPSIRDITKQDINLVRECESHQESAKDSNSFAEVSDCVMSSYQNEQYLCETMEEHLLDFGFDEDYGCFESEDKGVVEEDPYAVNRNYFILSSGWFDTIRENTAKPTIDREFEDYFSELMI